MNRIILFNKKICIEIITIIAISISVGLLRNLIYEESLSLFGIYDLKTSERNLYEIGAYNIDNSIEVDAYAVKHLYENNIALIIDIRSYVKYNDGHIPSSINLDSFNSMNLSNPKDIVIIVTDESSNKILSRYYRKLIKKGVKKILVYKRGIKDWIENGFPIEKSNSQK